MSDSEQPDQNDCPVRVQDVDTAHIIWGKNIAALRKEYTEETKGLCKGPERAIKKATQGSLDDG